MSSRTTTTTSKPSINSRNISDLSSGTQDGSGDVKPVKRLPPIKAPVGLAPSPDLKSCKSKVGSLHNIKHKPAGGEVTIPSQKLKWNAKSKVGSLENKEHKPAGGDLKIESRKLEWKTSSKVQSLVNVNHKPGGGNVKIFNESYREKALSPAKLDGNSNDNQDQHEAKSSASKSLSSSASKSGASSLSKDLKGLKL